MRKEMLSGDMVIDFNRYLLEADLKGIKKHFKELNETVVKDLDDYFNCICELAKMDSQIFKSFIRRLLRGRK